MTKIKGSLSDQLALFADTQDEAPPVDDAQIMLDLETLGTGHDAVILSIGAVKFTKDEIIDRFHVAVDPLSCQVLGLRIDAETVMWWMDEERDDARRDLLTHERVDLASALTGLTLWIDGDRPLWGNGIAFDNVIIRNAYDAAGLECPVSFRNDRCYRTVKNLAPAISLEHIGLSHNALHDAQSQAEHLQRILPYLGAEL